MISIQSLLTPIGQPAARSWLVARLVSYGVPAHLWRPRGSLSSILTAVSYLLAAFAATVTAALGGGYLPTATGAWLRALAIYRYGVTPQEASYGTGEVVLENTGASMVSAGPGQFIVQADNGRTFANVDPVALMPGTHQFPSAQSVTFQAQILGQAGGAAAGTITRLGTSVLSVTATNPAAIVGSNGDSDTKVRQACLAAIAARSYHGPEGAFFASVYGYGGLPPATNVSTGKPVNVNRIAVQNDPSTGMVTAWLASPSGAADSNDVAGVQVAINAMALTMCSAAVAASATVVTLPIGFVVWTTAATPAALRRIRLAALDAIDNATAHYPIGGKCKPPATQGYLFASYLEGVVASVDPSIYAVDVAGGNAALAPGQVAVVIPTVVVRQS